MARKQNERRRLGKETVFKIHRKEVSLKNLGQYWQRYLDSITDMKVDMRPSTPKDLTCLTPTPSPIAAPDEMNYHHKLLRSVQDHCYRNVEARYWVVQEGTRKCVSSLGPAGQGRRMNMDISTAHDFANSGNIVQPQKTLELAVPVIKEMITDRGPLLVPCFLGYLKMAYRKGIREWQTALADYTFRVMDHIKSSLGTQDPLYLILQYFSDRKIKIDDLYKRICKCLTDSLLAKFGHGCSTAANFMFDYIQEFWLESDSVMAFTALEKLINTCENIYGSGSTTTINARNTLALCLHSKQRFGEAEIAQLQAVAECDLTHDQKSVGFYCRQLANLATYQDANGKPNAAEATLREAYQNCRIVCGASDSDTLRVLRS